MEMLEALKKYKRISRKCWKQYPFLGGIYLYLERTVVKSCLPSGKENAIISVKELEADDWEEYKGEE